MGLQVRVIDDKRCHFRDDKTSGQRWPTSVLAFLVENVLKFLIGWAAKHVNFANARELQIHVHTL